MSSLPASVGAAIIGLHNLRSFESKLLVTVRRAQARGTPVSMLVLDVDHLKKINDVHGHLAGAEAVRKVGHIIGDSLDWFSKAEPLSATRRPTSLRIAAQRGFSAFQK